jgi:hypothetical protein
LDEVPLPGQLARAAADANLPVVYLSREGAADALDYSCLAAHEAPDAAYVRRELGIAPDAPVVVASFPASAECEALLDMFAEARRAHPGAVLLLEVRKATPWQRALSHRGWKVAARSSARSKSPFDVMLLDVPAETPGLAAGASAVILGGTFSDGPSPASPAWFAPLGAPVLVGPAIDSGDRVTRRFVESSAVVPADQIVALLGDRAMARSACDRARALAAEPEAAAEEIMQRLIPLLPAPPQENPDRQGWRIKTRVDRFADTSVGRWIAETRSRRRIESWDALRARLGSPRVVLCLGNGPSSEDSGLRDLAHDRLFRVNWRWQRRGLLTRPDVVFVGDPRTVHHVTNCIFAFGAKDWERTMLLRHALALRPKAPEYFTMERLPSVLQEHAWWARPSNGALMIVAAAALRPERIVVAGIDLFAHPDGRYPGDVRSTNDYAQVHRRDVDVAVIRQALQNYDGTVQIVGGVLENALAQES